LCLGVRDPAPRYCVACESCSASNPSIYLSIYLALACAAWAASPPETRAVARPSLVSDYPRPTLPLSHTLVSPQQPPSAPLHTLLHLAVSYLLPRRRQSSKGQGDTPSALDRAAGCTPARTAHPAPALNTLQGTNGLVGITHNMHQGSAERSTVIAVDI